MGSVRDIFRGSLVALVTPFRGGEVDNQAVEDLVEWQIAKGTSALVISGTTGESPTLSETERTDLFRRVVTIAAGRVPVVAGTGSNHTAHVIAASRRAEEVGADGLLIVTPYYNKPSQAGLVAHYRAVADAVTIPICLYSVPSRTGCEIAPETVAELARHENIAAIKEAGGSVDRVTRIRLATDLPILSGDDPLALPMMAVGAVGVISVTANILPAETARLASAALAGDWETAREIHYRLYRISQAMFIDTNPVPVKTALAMMGRVKEEFRLPLVGISDQNRSKLRAILAEFDLLPA
jgi:4-hydroxy-tetrahydrodipicolinate synthase